MGQRYRIHAGWVVLAFVAVCGWVVFCANTPGLSAPVSSADNKPSWTRPYVGVSRNDVDATTLGKKVMCGYQGWFSCPNDAANVGWRHWSRDGRRISPQSLTFEMWPDLSEYGEDEKYPAPGFTYPDGSPAALFSSNNPHTVDRHFDWMQKYGIDGVFVQRFVGGLKDPPAASRVLGEARDAANRTGRVFAITYDMTGPPADKLYDLIAADWKWLNEDMKITADARYLHEGGLPVVHLYGFFDDRFDAKTADRLIDLFKKDSPHKAYLMGGTQWYWRQEKNADWAKSFRRFDAISPWNVGNTMRRDGKTFASTTNWKADLAAAKEANMLYVPVVYPGFSWDNLQRKSPGSTGIGRLGGEFFWDQFSKAQNLGLDVAYVAMFDEVDEGTAIFKVSNTPPTQGHFATYEGLPADWYLRLTGQATKLMRGELKNTGEMPIKP